MTFILLEEKDGVSRITKRVRNRARKFWTHADPLLNSEELDVLHILLAIGKNAEKKITT